MRYPTISLSRCDEIARERIAGADPSIEPAWVGEGDDLDLGPIEQAAKQVEVLLQEHRKQSDRDHVEGLAAEKLYPAVALLDVPTLDDPGFWRYLALAYFWEFIKWRQPAPFKTGNHMQVLDAQHARNTILTRMYLRVASVGGLENVDYTVRVKETTDFWQSHVFNVRTASAPALVRAMVNRQANDRLATKPLRSFAKRVSGMWTNVLLNLYDDEEAAELVDELWRDDK